MSRDVADDLMRALRTDETFVRASAELEEGQREGVEASARQLAMLFAPVIRSLEEITGDEARLDALRAELAKRLTAG